MRIRLIVMTCLLWIALATPDARAQDVSWAERLGGASADYSIGFAVDGGGNAYATGYFYGTADFGSYSLTSAGDADVFVLKLLQCGYFFVNQSIYGRLLFPPLCTRDASDLT